MTDRRTQIAEAGVRILAQRGVRALTHRAIDEELELPPGSTSSYARTRRELIELIVGYLSGRTEGELIAPRLPEALSSAVVADLLAAALAASAEPADEQRARLLLVLEDHQDAELRSALVARPQLRSAFLTTAAAVLELLQVPDPDAHAGTLVGLLDALLLQRVIGTAELDERAVLTAYLDGLPRLGAEADRPGLNPAATARDWLSRIRRR